MITLDLCKHIPMQRFDIFSPKYSTKQVLLKASKVRENNKIVFTKAPSMGTQPWYISGKEVKKFKKISNGVIDTYAVPLDKLTPLELSQRCEHSD